MPANLAGKSAKEEEEKMKKLFFVVMMVALTMALAQLAPAETKFIKATGGGYIVSDCGGEAIASFGFFAKSVEITPGYANPAKGELQYSDLGCDDACRNIHGKITSITDYGSGEVGMGGMTDDGYYFNLNVIDKPDGPDEFQLVVFSAGPIYLCTPDFPNLLGGDITVEVKTKD